MEPTLANIAISAAIWITISIAAGLAIGKAVNLMLDDDGLDGCEGCESCTSEADSESLEAYERIPTGAEVWSAIHNRHFGELILMASTATAEPGESLSGKRLARYGFINAEIPFIESEISWTEGAEDSPVPTFKVAKYWLCVPTGGYAAQNAGHP
jgi:hypothetical protein